MPCSSITLGLVWQSRKGERGGEVQSGEDVCFGVKAIAYVLFHWHPAPSPLPFMTLCVSLAWCLFVSISVVHEVGVESWG